MSKEFWLKNKSMQGGWFYAKSLEKWVSTAPMKVTDMGVREAAIRQGIELWWDDEGRIARLNFYEAKKLLAELGLEMLSPTEYWRALQDAKNADNQLMVTELTSNRYAEWLDVLFFQNNDRYFMVSHPTIKAGRWKKFSDQEKAVEINMPKGRYGWLKFGGADSVFEVIDSIYGFPVEGKVLKNRPRKGMIFKYWDIFDGAPIKGAIRGYVTSSGTPSLDCAMPLTVADAPLLMVRACRKELPESERDLSMIKMLENIGQLYDELMRKKKYADFYKQKENLLKTISLLSSETVKAIRKSRENNFIKIREKLADMLGMVYLYADRVKDNDGRREVLFLGKSLFGVTKDKISDASFTEFVLSSVRRVRASLKNQKPVVFVMGHKSPDTDTVISALFEAYRNQLINPHVEYVPVVQGDTLPDEVMVLLNNRVLSESILLSTNRVYDRAVKFGQVTWVLVDHNVSEVQKFVVSILDHHTPSEVALRQDVAKTIEIVGSTAGMVVTRFWGMGLPLEKEMARVCYGATLMDTENRSRYKMTLKDEVVMQKLENAVGKVFGFYSRLMDSLLRTTDADLLFSRDYKEDWGFGFAVAKVKGVFGRPGGEVIRREILTRLVALAGQNNVRKNLPLTMVKVVDYEVDNETVFKERMYFIFGNGASDQFKEEVFKIFAIILESEFQSTKLEILQKNIYTEWLGVGKQLSRKKIAPILLPVVKTFNEYFYSEKVKMYVSRDFLKKTKKIDDTANRLGIALSTNEDGYVNFLTPLEIFLLTEGLGFAVPTLKEYAMIRNEAKLRKDEQMVSSLESHRFVEVLGTVTLKYGAKANETEVVEHPSVIRDRGGKLKIRGNGRIMSVPRAEPGLIVWDEVDPKTGLPEKVFYPGKDQIDENTVYSRYWSPEIGEQCVFTRGSIFIYKMTCRDGKVRLDETHPNLGVRVCRTSLGKPLIITSTQKGVVLTDVINDGVMLSYKNGVLLEEKDAPFEDITDRVYKELLVVDKKNHALELEPYLAGVVPAMFRESLSKSAIGEVQIHYGPATFVEKVNPRLFCGYMDISIVDPDGCKIGWFVKDGGRGKKNFLITNIRGISKLKHNLYALRLLGMGTVPIYDYRYDFENFTKKIIDRELGAEKVAVIAIGKSIFERKLLRKIKYGAIYERIAEDIKKSKSLSIKDWLQRQLKIVPDDYFSIPYVKETLQKMQLILDRQVSRKDLLTYWIYGDIVEDYVRLITTLNRRMIEITKFAKMLQVDVDRVRVSNDGIIIYMEKGKLVHVDISKLVNITNGKEITFMAGIDRRMIEWVTRGHPDLKESIEKIFDYVNYFGEKEMSLRDYTKLPTLQKLANRFGVKMADDEVVGIHILSHPVDGEWAKMARILVGRYPFGTLAEDFVLAGVKRGAMLYVHFGSCGFLYKDEAEVERFNLRPADLVIPEKMYKKDGSFLTEIDGTRVIEAVKVILKKSDRPFRILRRVGKDLVVVGGLKEGDNRPDMINIVITKHVSVDTPLEEDTKLVESYKKRGITSVDCETAKVVERVKNEGLSLNYEFMFWIADLPGKEGETLTNEKQLHPISDQTRMRKTQGLMSDVYMYLRLDDKSSVE